MRATTIAAATAALFASSVAAGGKAIVHNMCSFNVYAWAIDASACIDGAVARNPLVPHTLAPGASYKEHMRELITGGVSIKLSNQPSLSEGITQLEYTKNYDTWYDLSNVNCQGAECPFAPHGMYMKSGSGCPTVSCAASDQTCHGAYNNPDDNWASLCCPEGDPDVVVYLCQDSADGSVPAPPVAPSPTTSSIYSSYSAPMSIEEAVTTTPKPKIHRPKPTPVEPVTQIYETTEVQTVIVTVTPHPGDHAKRHVHHPHGHH